MNESTVTHLNCGHFCFHPTNRVQYKFKALLFSLKSIRIAWFGSEVNFQQSSRCNQWKVTLTAKCISPNCKMYFLIAKCIPLNCKMDFSKLQNVFFQIAKCISFNCKMCLSKLQNVFLKIAKCISPNHKMYFT